MNFRVIFRLTREGGRGVAEADVIERILRHHGLWDASVRVEFARDPPEPVILPWLDDPFPNYDHEPVFAEN